ncbi:MAG: transposase [Acidobacteriia bacterium]|nr:transposase [Terriglobia bacterium]
MKYRPECPDCFGSKEHARSFCQQFFPWYNTEHDHSGLGLLTPGGRAHPTCPSGPRSPTHPGCRLRGTPGTFGPETSAAARAAHRGLDQPTSADFKMALSSHLSAGPKWVWT